MSKMPELTKEEFGKKLAEYGYERLASSMFEYRRIIGHYAFFLEKRSIKGNSGYTLDLHFRSQFGSGEISGSVDKADIIGFDFEKVKREEKRMAKKAQQFYSKLIKDAKPPKGLEALLKTG